MRPPSGQPAYDQTWLKRLERAEKNIDRLSRRRVDMPKIPAPTVVAGGGGIVGQARAVSTSLSSGTFRPGEFQQWQFNDEQGQPIGLNDNLNPGQNGFTAAPGWYSGKVFVDLYVEQSVVVQVNYNAGTAAYSEFRWVPGGGGRVGLTGVFWLPEAYLYPRLGVRVMGLPAGVVGSCDYYLTRHA